MDKIVCLVGASGSGKTTLAKELEELGYNIVYSYTTRKEREPGEWGHIFTSYIPKKWEKVREGSWERESLVIDKINMIACKEIYGFHYWATRGQYQGKGTSIYIVDPDGANQVKENVKNAEVVTVFLMADEEKRSDRLLKRYDPEAYCQGSTWLPDEVIIRLLRDFKIFKTCKCDYVVDANREVEEVLEDVIEIIEGEI